MSICKGVAVSRFPGPVVTKVLRFKAKVPTLGAGGHGCSVDG